MSFWTVPTVAANRAVAAPTKVTTAVAVALVWNIGDRRQTMNTPAVTMVAAWMRAETGVGPSIASGSQVCSGTCADLANAPTSSRMQPATSDAWSTEKARSTAANVLRKSSDPVPRMMKNVPSTRPTSPTTLITNALMPAVVAVVRRYQNEISRYDAAPTNAHPTMRITKFAARTSSSMLKTKKFRYAKKRV